MDQEGSAAVDSGTQHAQAFVGGIPGFHDDIVQFIAQEVFDHSFIARLHFEEVREHAHGRKASVHYARLKQAANGFGGVSMLGDDGFERTFLAKSGSVLRA